MTEGSPSVTRSAIRSIATGLERTTREANLSVPLSPAVNQKLRAKREEEPQSDPTTSSSNAAAASSSQGPIMHEAKHGERHEGYGEGEGDESDEDEGALMNWTQDLNA
mgnify:CR=1 FL=1